MFFCKPVAKTPQDRVALVRAAMKKNSKFFLGSDSAPHPVQAKTGQGKKAAGCFTQPHVTALVVDALEQGVTNGWIEDDALTIEALNGFCSARGLTFYQIATSDTDRQEKIILEKGHHTIEQYLKSNDEEIEVIPFRAGRDIRSLCWEQATS